jgi:DNA-binding CsgD family transcriptional regulator
LYTIVHDESDDPIASLAVLDKLSECARKGASSHARMFALVASFDLEVERGDDLVLERLDGEMQENQVSLRRLRTTAILPAQALRAAWLRDFSSAYAMLAGTAPEQSASEQRALRAAETALYACAAGLHEEGEAALRDATAVLEASDSSTKRTIRARLFVALTELVRGHDANAHRHLLEAERALTPGMPRLRALTHAIRTMYRVRLGQSDAETLTAALERLRSVHFGGLARLLLALPMTAGESGYGSLTPAEREILQLLAKGASTKEVANQTGRSPHTVDTHIRSICRKLSCSGRREAVALATSQGWVQA